MWSSQHCEMNSNIYRYSTLGESLSTTLEQLADEHNVSEYICERIRCKFDQIANSQIGQLANSKDKERLATNPAHFVGIEYEFKFTDGQLNRRLEAGAQRHTHKK